jgi:hypothetical protein
VIVFHAVLGRQTTSPSALACLGFSFFTVPQFRDSGRSGFD